jgi:hypothetical protein
MYHDNPLFRGRSAMDAGRALQNVRRNEIRMRGAHHELPETLSEATLEARCAQIISKGVRKFRAEGLI